jgi:DNA-binding transcriptional ArsR family regulator
MSADKTFLALSSPIRRRILAYLSEVSLTSTEIADRFEMSKPAISKHLGILENAGLVTFEKRAQFVHYSLARENLVANLHDFLAGVCPQGRVFKKESVAIAKARKTRKDA